MKFERKFLHELNEFDEFVLFTTRGQEADFKSPIFIKERVSVIRPSYFLCPIKDQPFSEIFMSVDTLVYKILK